MRVDIKIETVLKMCKFLNVNCNLNDATVTTYKKEIKKNNGINFGESWTNCIDMPNLRSNDSVRPSPIDCYINLSNFGQEKDWIKKKGIFFGIKKAVESWNSKVKLMFAVWKSENVEFEETYFLYKSLFKCLTL